MMVPPGACQRAPTSEQVMSDSLELAVEPSWRSAHPGALVGLLALSGIAQDTGEPPAFAARCEAVATELRRRFAGKSRADLLAELPVLQAYAAYYRRFKKTYHVLLQLESVVFKGRAIGGGMPLVTAAFMAELQSQLLTATHNLDALHPPLRLIAARGDECYTALNGEQVQAKPGDMLMADEAGPICTVIAGQSRESSVRTGTRRALFVVYAPPGIAADGVERHLDEVEALVRLFAPAAQTEGRRVVTA
jgi:DNA/RNA-binding domain of Phe-tRNA-synthetase-like protein